MQNPFQQGGASYAAHRPDYPGDLLAFLAGQAPARQLAVDIGCGSGQLTLALAGHFERVMGIDPSASQIMHAQAADNIQYRQAEAETVDIAPLKADLIVAAQAAHWFDLPAFYKNLGKFAKDHALLALITYGVPRLTGDEQADFADLYWGRIHDFWPPARQHVENGYANFDFPFAEISLPALSISCQWGRADILGYVQTWSSVKAAYNAGQGEVVTQFLRDLGQLWGDQIREISWPLQGRLGFIQGDKI